MKLWDKGYEPDKLIEMFSITYGVTRIATIGHELFTNILLMINSRLFV